MEDETGDQFGGNMFMRNVWAQGRSKWVLLVRNHRLSFCA